MTLLEDYQAARNSDFRARVLAALWGRATTFLQTTPDPTDAAVRRQLRLAKQILSTTNDGMDAVINALASAGLTTATEDAQIESAIDNNWTALALLIDENIDPIA